MLKIHSDTAEAPLWNCLKGFDPLRLSDNGEPDWVYQVGAGFWGQDRWDFHAC
jgi:hypothetical protein